VARKVKASIRQFYQLHRWGDHWAKLTMEWSEHPDTPEKWKQMAEQIAEEAFMASAAKVRDVVSAMNGKTK
jgi:hypothetical protein